MVLGRCLETINGTREILRSNKWYLGDALKQKMVLGRYLEAVYGTREMPETINGTKKIPRSSHRYEGDILKEATSFCSQFISKPICMFISVFTKASH